ncbi:3-keto-steroid reductase [Podospora fimiseda]|uniref:3-keto-steroid reductase n=1 Tax=Podospora fimiseda TaxID=252190 RepID=A0AAN7BZF6_9PEZI|nr:3-keto-steroid reductase [Podospora fimiseda]
MAPAPWEQVPAEDTLFVLVTGANSGIGFGICQRLIDEYLTTRSRTSHIVVIPTTRSVKKSQETVNALRRHVKEFATTSKVLRTRGPDYDPKETTRRVHILSIQVDLCNLPTITQAANQLISGTVSNPSDSDDFISLDNVKIPRLDSVIFNAGMGGWYGLDWPKVFHNIFTAGIVSATTWPTFKGADSGQIVKPVPSSDETMGQVFCANVFGHYLFAQKLIPLLNRPATNPTLSPGRIIWETSIEPDWDCFSLDDFQAINTKTAYESTKRLTDILALTSSLPASKTFIDSYLSTPLDDEKTAPPTPPKIYLVHPGVVQTTLFPLNAFLFFWYMVVLYITRFLGSPWHPITVYNGACAPAWLALQEQEWLDSVDAERIKWGTSTDIWGKCRVKKTEVDGWGWEGKVEEVRELRAQGKLSGRRPGSQDLTEDRLTEFKALGAACWKKMEELRAFWEAKLGKSENK